MAKVIELSKIFKGKYFSGSKSWLAQFQKTLCKSSKGLYREAKFADVTSAEDYIQHRWQQESLGFKPNTQCDA